MDYQRSHLISFRKVDLLLSRSSASGSCICFFFNYTATTEIYTLSLHDALPICGRRAAGFVRRAGPGRDRRTIPQMDAPLLQIKQVSKHYGGSTALSGVSLDIARGERFGLIGPNGSGKTTLINCISGSLRNDAGSIRFENSEISGLAAYQRTRRGIARSFQIPRPFHTMSVLENLLVPSAYVVHLREAEAEAKAMEILSSIGLAGKAGDRKSVV